MSACYRAAVLPHCLVPAVREHGGCLPTVLFAANPLSSPLQGRHGARVYTCLTAIERRTKLASCSLAGSPTEAWCACISTFRWACATPPLWGATCPSHPTLGEFFKDLRWLVFCRACSRLIPSRLQQALPLLPRYEPQPTRWCWPAPAARKRGRTASHQRFAR